MNRIFSLSCIDFDSRKRSFNVNSLCSINAVSKYYQQTYYSGLIHKLCSSYLAGHLEKEIKPESARAQTRQYHPHVQFQAIRLFSLLFRIHHRILNYRIEQKKLGLFVSRSGLFYSPLLTSHSFLLLVAKDSNTNIVDCMV